MSCISFDERSILNFQNRLVEFIFSRETIIITKLGLQIGIALKFLKLII